jgi:hypothetical protein
MSYGYSATVPDYQGYDEAVRRRSAPASVRVLATVQYLAGLALLAVAGLIVLTAAGGTRYTDPVSGHLLHSQGVSAAGLYGFAGLFVLVIGRKLHRGRQWARVFVLAVSVVTASATLYDGLAGTGTRTNVLIGLVCPVVYLVLLNTAAARAWYARRGY